MAETIPLVDFTGFRDGDADARRRQLPEVARQARGRGHQAPKKDTDGDNAPPTVPIGHAGNRNANQSVEDRERQPLQQPDTKV